jgi:tetratricopeptide (TPR) repeat protein
LEYLKKAEKLFKQIKHNKNLADVYTMFAFVASNMNETQKCLDYNEKALALRKQLGHKILESSSYSNLANNFFKLELFPKAFQYQKNALKLALKSEHYYYSNKYAHALYKMYKERQKYDSSLYYLEIADSISKFIPTNLNNIGSGNLIQNKIKLQNKEKLEQNKYQIEKTKQQLEYSVYISLLLLLIIVVFLLWIFKLKKNISTAVD